ncbi:MAG: porin family protein [Prevotellaceae bacterium]|nr:porin family protein [Prevotellaceae bacterium]
MKKMILLIAALLVSASYAGAQIRIGAKASATVSRDLKAVEGWQAGIVPKIRIPILGLGVQPEVLYAYSSRGGENRSWLNVPVNLFWQLGLPIVKPILLAGPYFGYTLKRTENNDLKLDPFNWGIGLGAGVEIIKIQVEARYNFAVKSETGGSINLANNTLNVSLVYFF